MCLIGAHSGALAGVPTLAPLQRALVCAQHLQIVGKTLSSAQLDIIARAESMRVPLFARIVSDELRLLGKFDELSARLTKYVGIASTRALRQHVLERLVAEFRAPDGVSPARACPDHLSPARQSTSLVGSVLACLLVVPVGLTEAELLATSQCPPAAWSQLSTALDGALVRRGELLTLADDDVVAVARSLCTDSALQLARQRLDVIAPLCPPP